MAEDEGFCRPIHHLPHYSLWRHSYFPDVSLPTLYDVVFSNVTNIIFTTDLGSSEVSQSPVSVISGKNILVIGSAQNFHISVPLVLRFKQTIQQTASIYVNFTDAFIKRYTSEDQTVPGTMEDKGLAQSPISKTTQTSMGFKRATLRPLTHRGTSCHWSWCRLNNSKSETFSQAFSTESLSWSCIQVGLPHTGKGTTYTKLSCKSLLYNPAAKSLTASKQ